MTTTAPPWISPALLAATVMLLRDGPQGLEVFMVARHHQIDFAAGALVFPGGKLAKGDVHETVRLRCLGVQDLNEEQLGLRVASIREVFEECGVLLAREHGVPAFISADRAQELGSRYRKTLENGSVGIGEMLEAENLELACDELVPFAHWITPTFMSKRFDTHFYLAAAPQRQLALHDGRELVDSVWIRPQDALVEAEAGTRTIVPVTRLNLLKLARSNTVSDALATARDDRIVTVLPERVSTPRGTWLQIPEQAGYGVAEFQIPGASD